MSCPSSPARSANPLENDDIVVDQLIALVQRRAPLWDKFNKKYHDRISKARLWEEIYHNLYVTWDQYSDAERKQKGADVQRKWKNLKDTYFRELAADKKLVSGQGAKKKKRPYVHMKALSFLASQKSFRETTNNVRDTESTNSNTEDLTTQTDEDTDTEATRNRRLKASMRKKTRIQNNSDDELLKLLQDKKYDEDVSFCEMMIPMLKKLSTEQKHYAKIGILNVLNRATTYSENFMPPRASSTLSQYQPFSSTHSSYNENTPSPCPNTIRQSPSPQILSHNPTVIPQSQPDPTPHIQYTPSRNPTVIPQSQPDPSLTQYHALSHNSDFPNTTFGHSSYVVEGSAFDMKDYVIFK